MTHVRPRTRTFGDVRAQGWEEPPCVGRARRRTRQRTRSVRTYDRTGHVAGVNGRVLPLRTSVRLVLYYGG